MGAQKKFKIFSFIMALLYLWHYVTVVCFIAKKDANTHRGAADSIDDSAVLNSGISVSNTPYPGATVYTRYSVDRLGLSPLPDVKPLKPELGPVFNDVTSIRFPISIPSFREVHGRRNIFIAAISATSNFEQRALIRQTWAKDLNALNRSLTGFAGFAFILGRTKDGAIQKQIEEESATHKDIIQIDMIDVYRNLLIKMAGLFNWLHKNCSSFKGFIVKVDDDIYIRVRTLEYFIHSYDPFCPSIFGFRAAGLDYPPVRGKN